MWYVLQVRAGTEERIKSQCRKIISEDILEQCFIPRYMEKKRYQGIWKIEEKILFPGYIFLVSNQLTALCKNIQKIVGMAKMVGTGGEIIALKEEEVKFFERMDVRKNIVGISKGISENGVITVMEGPLKGMESYISKIDRHKRKAWLKVEMFDRIVDMEIGFEVIAKY